MAQPVARPLTGKALLLEALFDLKVPKFEEKTAGPSSPTKSRLSFNFGRLFNSKGLGALSSAFADAIFASDVYDPKAGGIHLVGSPEKGNVVAASVEACLRERYGFTVELSLLRRQAKKEAERQHTFGVKIPKGRKVFILDDTFGTGSGLNDAANRIVADHRGVIVGGAYVGIDRRKLSAAQSIHKLKFPIVAILDIDDILAEARKREYFKKPELATIVAEYTRH
jgi:orotate phosphoribosyltransferase